MMLWVAGVRVAFRSAPVYQENVVPERPAKTKGRGVCAP